MNVKTVKNFSRQLVTQFDNIRTRNSASTIHINPETGAKDNYRINVIPNGTTINVIQGRPTRRTYHQIKGPLAAVMGPHRDLLPGLFSAILDVFGADKTNMTCQTLNGAVYLSGPNFMVVVERNPEVSALTPQAMP